MKLIAGILLLATSALSQTHDKSAISGIWEGSATVRGQQVPVRLRINGTASDLKKIAARRRLFLLRGRMGLWTTGHRFACMLRDSASGKLLDENDQAKQDGGDSIAKLTNSPCILRNSLPYP